MTRLDVLFTFLLAVKKGGPQGARNDIYAIYEPQPIDPSIFEIPAYCLSDSNPQPPSEDNDNDNDEDALTSAEVTGIAVGCIAGVPLTLTQSLPIPIPLAL